MMTIGHEQAAELGLISAEQAAAVGEMNAFADRWHEEYKRLLVRFAAVICGCPPAFTWHSGIAPQASCPLHSQAGSLL